MSTLWNCIVSFLYLTAAYFLYSWGGLEYIFIAISAFLAISYIFMVLAMDKPIFWESVIMAVCCFVIQTNYGWPMVPVVIILLIRSSPADCQGEG